MHASCMTLTACAPLWHVAHAGASHPVTPMWWHCSQETPLFACTEWEKTTMGASLSERTTPALRSSPVMKSSTRCTLVHWGTLDEWEPACAAGAAGAAGAGAVFAWDAAEFASVSWG